MNEEHITIIHIATEIKQMAAAVRELINMVNGKNAFLKEARGLTESIEDHGTELIKVVEKKEKK